MNLPFRLNNIQPAFYLILCLFMALSTSCSNTNNNSNQEVSSSDSLVQDSSERTVFYAYKTTDTIRLDTTLFDGYSIRISSYSLNDSGIIWDEDDTTGKRVNNVTHYLHNAVLHIELSSNGKPIHDVNFSKLDFTHILGEYRMSFCDRVYPDIAVVNDQLGYVIVNLLTCMPETDDCNDGFLKIRIPELTTMATGMHGGMWCSSDISILENENILTCHGLHNASGEVLLDISDRYNVAAEKIGNDHFVIIHDLVEYKTVEDENGNNRWTSIEDEITDNAHIYHMNGEEIASFRYDGYLEPMGYECPLIRLSDSILVLLDIEGMQAYKITNNELEISKLFDYTDEDLTDFRKFEVHTVIGDFTIFSNGEEFFKKAENS